MDLIQNAHPKQRLTNEDRVALIAVDDCNKMVFRFSDLEVDAEQSIFEIIPELVCQILPNPETHIDLPQISILEVLDLMTNYTVGWSVDLGRATD